MRKKMRKCSYLAHLGVMSLAMEQYFHRVLNLRFMIGPIAILNNVGRFSIFEFMWVVDFVEDV